MKNKFGSFFAALDKAKKAGADLDKETAVSEHTAGRTESLKALSPLEYATLVSKLNALTRVFVPQKLSHAEETKDTLRKAIISQFHRLHGITDESSPTERREAVKGAIAWAEKYGALKKKRRFNEYTASELYELRDKAQKLNLSANQALRDASRRKLDK